MRIWFPILALIALFSSSLASAALGKTANSVSADAEALGTSATVTRHPQYSRYEISRDWLRLHEFAGPRGNVFALAWNGRRHPDLRQLLGEHFPDFQAAITMARQEHRRGGAIILDSSDFHLEIGGHMMSVYGLIWLKNQLPRGMNLNEIR